MKNFDYYLEQIEITKTETKTINSKDVLNPPNIKDSGSAGDISEYEFKINSIDTENNKIIIQNIKTNKLKAIDLCDSMKDLKEGEIITERKEDDTYVYAPYKFIDPKTVSEINEADEKYKQNPNDISNRLNRIANINGLEHIKDLAKIVNKAKNMNDPYNYLTDEMLKYFKDPDEAEKAANKIIKAIKK